MGDTTKKKNKNPNPKKVDRFSETQEVMYGKFAEYSASYFINGRINVEPKWYRLQLNSQYRETVLSVEDHNYEHRAAFAHRAAFLVENGTVPGPRPPDPDYAYWIHQTEFQIRLPFRYYNTQSERNSLEYRMIMTNDGTRKSNEIFNTPVPPGEIEMEFFNLGALDKVVPRFNVGEYTFLFKYKVRIPNSQQLENAGREEHYQNEDNMYNENNDSDFEPDPFDATEWWRDQRGEDLYTGEQIRDMQMRWKEHLIQLAPKACNLLLPSSSTKPGKSTYKLQADHDYLLTQEFWRSFIENRNHRQHHIYLILLYKTIRLLS